ncbi:MAG: hypothetical protein AAF569_00670 [Pseudomonadota bacterium]
MGKVWTEERRRKQAETIRKTKPWEKSTGPKTAEGKRRSRLNALKHGDRCRISPSFVELQHLNKAFIEHAQEIAIWEREFQEVTNKLKEMRLKSKTSPPRNTPEEPTN